MSKPRIPVSILTGFLGAGKTTLLKRWMADPAIEPFAVVVNEFGEIGLDGELVRSGDETVVMMDSGCLCCTIKGQVAETLGDLITARDRGDVPAFERIIIETTGLAEPGPILHTLMTAPLLAARCRVDSVITAVDAVHGMDQIETYAEARPQIAIAERLIVTKSDLPEAGSFDDLCKSLKQINALAPIHKASDPEVTDPAWLFGTALFAEPGQPTPDRWLGVAEQAAHHHAHDHTHATTLALEWDQPLPWPMLMAWLQPILAHFGDRILRLKAIVSLDDQPHPIALHGVHHLVHPPTELDMLDAAETPSRLVMITHNLPATALLAAWDEVAKGDHQPRVIAGAEPAEAH
ncbi:MAG: GTP-binding protein [Alphaproteobacteria bacterium]